jgi:SgrR family transcriptional regulator
MGTIVTEDESDFSLLERFLTEKNCLYRHMSPDHHLQVAQIVKKVCEDPASDKRLLIALELEEMVKADEAVLFLYHRHPKAQVHPSLKGVNINSLGWVDFRQVWFDRLPFNETEGKII